MKVIIGAGPAGIMAAVAAAERGNKVVLLEKNQKIGRKLAITGKGRCNMTNACEVEELFDAVSTNKSFLYSAFYGFTNADTVAFFEKNGVATKVERGGRVFPASDKAYDVVDALLMELRRVKVDIVRDNALEIIVRDGAVVAVKGEKRLYPCDAAVIATGGLSYPQTGSTGDGLRFARELGHTLTEPSPSLVPIVTRESTLPLQGLSLKNVTLTVKSPKGKVVFSELGELLFTHFGLSGPLVLSASSYMGENPKDYRMTIDMKPALTVEKLDERILRDFSEQLNRDLINSLGKLLPAKMIPYIVERSEIPAHTKLNSLTKQNRRRLGELIKNLEFTAEKYRPISEAIVTHGGVKVGEINPSTMESRLVKGLYFAGEVIDVDARTGGFNLQIAFSTGHLAGENM